MPLSLLLRGIRGFLANLSVYKARSLSHVSLNNESEVRKLHLLSTSLSQMQTLLVVSDVRRMHPT